MHAGFYACKYTYAGMYTRMYLCTNKFIHARVMYIAGMINAFGSIFATTFPDVFYLPFVHTLVHTPRC
jgi:hypothetical protein